MSPTHASRELCFWSDPPMTIEFLASVIDHVAHPIFVKNREFQWVLLNHALSEMVGYPRDQMLGKSDYDFFPKEEADFFRRKDREMFETGSQVVIEEEPITDAQGRRHVLATTKVPLRNAANEVTHLVGIIHDITRLKTAEEALRLANEELERRVIERTAALAQAQNELLRKERLAVLGRLAGGLAHQIRNPLAAISNASTLLRRALGRTANDAALSALVVIEEEVWQANRTITDLLDYARVRPAVARTVDVRSVLEQVLRAQELPKDVRVDNHIPNDCYAAADEDQLRGALGNLVRNAVEAMPLGGTLTLNAERQSYGWKVSIMDTGAGIPKDVRGRLFEPLVTTKPLGLGLGLTTARTLIENQGGSVDCQSIEGVGTRFEVRLPSMARTPPPGG